MNREVRNLIIFFVATFIWTWAFYAPIVLTGNSPYQMPGMILLIVGGAGPSVVGLAMVFLTYDREQRRDYLRRCLSIRRISLRWWLVILLVNPLVFAIASVVDVALGGTAPGMTQLQALAANLLAVPSTVGLWLMSGPISEEFGWRGYALDPIIKRLGTLPGTLAMGVIWAVWHLPLFFMPATWHGQVGFRLAGFWTFILMNVGLSLVMTWVYRNTARTILVGILLHFTSNFTANMLAPTSEVVEVVRAVLLFGIGLTACLLMVRSTQEPQLP